MEFNFITVDRAAEILGVTEKSVREFIAKGELKAAKIGQWKIREEDLRDFIEARSNRAIEAFLHGEGEGEVEGSLTICTIIDYYTDNPQSLTEELMSHVNSELKYTTSIRWTYAWHQETGRARYTVWGPPGFLARLLGVLESYTAREKGEEGK